MNIATNFIGSDEVVQVLIKRKEELELMSAMVEERIDEAPQGTLRISHTGGYTQFYHRIEPGDTRGKYIRKKECELARLLAQKEYDIRVLDEIKKQIDEIEAFLNSYKPQNITNVFDEINVYRKPMVTPVAISDYDYAMMWKNVDYQGKGVSDDAMELYSDAGERVRSKSEVIIANKLHNLGIAYRYEFPIKFMSGRIVYPDFYCLNVRKRREIVYEHFGMMDDPEYANNTVKKIEEYQRNGYWLGKNFIATFESSRKSINTLEIEELAKQYLL